VWVFVFKKFEGKLIDSPEGHLEWIENKKLVTLNLWDGDKIFIPWLFQQECFSAKFIYEDRKYISHTVTFH
jgi:8-oxo-dGTP diphosphatase